MMTLSRALGLYLHIPFCRQRCHFCAFYLEVARADRLAAFCSALAREIRLYRERNVHKGRPLRTVYFGGGTPTALPTRELVSLLDLIRATWTTDPEVEVTVEAHPSTVEAADLRLLVAAGVTRISFGAESMDDRDFASIGRPGTVKETGVAVAAARAAGFTNINIDLMYGLPGQSLQSWTQTLKSLLALEPAHVSCYALTIEEGTKLAQDIERKLVPAPDESLQVEMDAAAERILTAAGFERYEISNYARPGTACRHNLLYWTGQDYLGLGPSAQSYIDGVRFGNVSDLTSYMALLREGTLPVGEQTALSPAEQWRDALVFGLRLTGGVPRETVDRSMHGPESRRILADLVSRGLIESDADRLRLTPLGRRYADSVAGALF
jgi:oxygen-independent coproporphyrinogen-3 oxidase